jgi:hypothetical protein
MKKFYLLNIIILLITKFGVSQTFQWVKTIGSNKEDQITSIAASNDGFVYVAGNFQDTIDLDNGPGVYPLISELYSYNEGQLDTLGSAYRQIFLAKYTSDGQIVWGKQFGGSYFDFAGLIKLDHAGDILLTGSYYFSIDFNYSDTLNGFGLSGVQNTFISKFSPNGDLIWDRRFEAGAYLPEYDYDYTNFIINDITFNDDNSMILCGSTTGQIDIYLNTVFNQNVINNRNTVFYQKLNSNGEIEFLKFIKGSSSSLFLNISAVSINQQGEFTLAGNFSDSLWINPDDPNYFIDLDSLSVQSPYGFFAHYNAAGVFQWSKSIIGGSALYNRDMVIDAYGNHYIAGVFAQPPNYLDTRPAIDFDPGPGQYIVPTESINSYTSSAFLASYTPSGDFRWAFWMFSPSSNTFLNGAVQGNFLELDAAERLIFGGLLNSVILDIDPGPNVVSLQSDVTGINGSSNPFIARYTTNGNYLSHKQFRGAGSCWQSGLSLDSSGSIYSSGFFAGYYKFNFPNNLVTSSTDFTSYNFPLGEFWEAQDGFYTKHQNCIQKTYINQTICSGDSMLYNGYQLKSSGQYPRVISTNSGCDQVEILNLNVIPAIAVNQFIGICEGETFTVGNQTFSQSGIYQTLFPASNGCDSLVTTNLTVESLNAQISLVDNVYSALNAPVDATFQWLDCNSNFDPLIAEVNPTYAASENGIYALEMSAGNCRDTSECLLFNTLGGINISNSSIQLFPNPVDKALVIQNIPVNQSLKLFDSTGRIIIEANPNSNSFIFDVSNFQNGFYVLRIGSFSKSIIVHHSNP